MKTLQFLIAAGALPIAFAVSAAPANTPVFSVNSVSGQFTAFEQRSPAIWDASLHPRAIESGSQAFILPLHPALTATNATRLTLEPALLVVSCERIKDQLLKDLGMTDAWASKIDLLIDNRLPDTAMPRLAAVHDRHEWTYRVDLPKTIEHQALVRAVVGAMLVEIANRSAGMRSAEVPLWLVEGMAAHVEASNLPLLTPDPGTGSENDHFALEGQRNIRWLLRDRRPLTFHQLTWPGNLDTSADKAFFRACSQLFLEELLNLPGGGAGLRQMLALLGRGVGAQDALLQAFHSHFASSLAVEKWWAVACVDFQSNDWGQFASTAEVFKKLQETLDVPVEVRLDPRLNPAEARITLQDAISRWTSTDSDVVVTRAIMRLQLQRYRSTDEMRPLIDAYIVALGNYLSSERAILRKTATLKNWKGQLAAVQGDIYRKLNALDAKRDEMRSTMLLARNQKPDLPVKTADSSRR